VEVVQGDFSKPRIGIDAQCWARLVGEVEVVVHAAAAVELGATFQQLSQVNVEGTRALLELCRGAGKGCALIHVSTNGIFPLVEPQAAPWREDFNTE